MKQKTLKRWTDNEERLLWNTVQNRQNSLSVCFIAVSEQTGRSTHAVAQHYTVMKKREHPVYEDEVSNTTVIGSKWTPEEDDVLIRYISARPQNLHACFLAVAEQTGRTPCGVAAHWYTNVSKRPDVKVLFTASKGHISMNRKNGEGVESNYSIWQRLLRVLRSIGL